MIDVMLPYFGDPELARQAAESVLNQSSPAWRLHVIDDNYPDRSIREWLRGIDDARVTYSRNETNLGVRGNFQRCVDLSESSHLVFLGGDDVMEPNYVEEVTATLGRHPSAAVVQPRVSVIDENGQHTTTVTDRVKGWIDPVDGVEQVLRGEGLATRLMVGNWLYFPAITWRRELVVQHPFRAMHTALDLGLLMDLVLAGHEFVLTPRQAFRYRRHAASVSSVTARSAERFGEESALFEEFARRCAALGWRSASRAARLHPTSRLHAMTCAVAAAQQRDLPLAGSLLARAVRP